MCKYRLGPDTGPGHIDLDAENIRTASGHRFTEDVAVEMGQRTTDEVWGRYLDVGDPDLAALAGC